MTELLKQFEVEMNWSLEQAKKDYKVGIFLHAYIEWLENQLIEVLENKTVEKFQEIIRTQCDEISILKAQLTWRPVSEPPTEDGIYLITDGGYYDTQKYCNGKWNIWSDSVGDWVVDDGETRHFRWLPIPPAPEGERG